MNLTTTAAYRAIKVYQYVMAGRPSPCRFVPSCSDYALESLATHGLLRGVRLTVFRLCRCHPWGGKGEDYVPPARS